MVKVRWWLLKWDAKARVYDVIETVEAENGPAALLSREWSKGNINAVARREGDHSIPLRGMKTNG